jgi:hypothetical protein
MSAWGAIAAIAGVIAVLLKAYLAKEPQRDEARHEKEIQQGRQDILDGDADAISRRVDRLPSPANSDTGGIADDEATSRRLSAICGMATDGHGDGEAVRGGGKVSD